MVRLEGADVPPGHPGQRQPLFLVGRGDGVTVELVGRQGHTATLANIADRTTLRACPRGPVSRAAPSENVTR